MSKLLAITDAKCRIGRHRLLDIPRFAIEPGEHWCLYGPNGAGKSLLSALATGQRMESGQYVSFAEGFDPSVDVARVSFEEQQKLWQRDNRLDVSEFNADALDRGTLVQELISGREPNQPELLNELVAALSLDDILQQGIRFLSSGQVRRALIARALYAAHSERHRLIVLDDPLESIDRASQQGIVDCIVSHLDDHCSSLLLCRRQQDILPGVTHMAVMDNLRIIASGPVTEVKDSPEFRAVSERKPVVPAKLPPAPDDLHESALLNREGPLIELRDVSARYGDHVVFQGLNWSMTKDHHVLIEGPNGCGKSTLLSLIDGENHKGYGQEVFLFGHRKGSGETVWDIKACFGIVSNELHNKYVKGWKVLDVVVSGFFDSVGLYDDSGSVEWEQARAWLRALDLESEEKHYYHEISFGQQRLVLLARAMVKHPRVLILDEPCVGLDDYHRELILGTLDVIAATTNTRIVYVSHVESERPACINQRLQFLPLDSGRFKLQSEAVS